MSFFSVAAEGFALGAGLIIAIGAQNAYVLRQGLLRQHVFPLAAFCAASDGILILLGCFGLGSLVQASPQALIVIAFAGAAFLAWYGIKAAMRAWKPGSLLPTEGAAPSLAKALATVAAVTLLNPHVYLDTVVLVGSLSGRHPLPDRYWFAGGAASASIVWFFGLGYGARLLEPLFKKQAAWRVLDSIIAVVMLLIASQLLRDGISRL